jgi:hypothetical protein
MLQIRFLTSEKSMHGQWTVKRKRIKINLESGIYVARYVEALPECI